MVSPLQEVIPICIYNSPPAVKTLYLFLAKEGEVSYSTRDLAWILGFSQPTICTALKNLRSEEVIEFVSNTQKKTYRLKKQ